LIHFYKSRTNEIVVLQVLMSEHHNAS